MSQNIDKIGIYEIAPFSHCNLISYFDDPAPFSGHMDSKKQKEKDYCPFKDSGSSLSSNKTFAGIWSIIVSTITLSAPFSTDDNFPAELEISTCQHTQQSVVESGKGISITK